MTDEKLIWTILAIAIGQATLILTVTFKLIDNLKDLLKSEIKRLEEKIDLAKLIK